MKEIWKQIEGYEGLYEVSNLGRVKRNLKILKPRLIRGYLSVHLCKNNESKNKAVHRLVAETFILNPNHLPVVNHRDGNKLNNFVENLEWCTRSENDLHAYRLNLRHSPSYWSGKTGEEHCKSKKVICVETGEIFPSITAANQKYKTTHVGSCISGKRSMTKGLHWKLAEG